MYSSIHGNKNSEPHHRMFCSKLGPGSAGSSLLRLVCATAVAALAPSQVGSGLQGGREEVLQRHQLFPFV